MNILIKFINNKMNIKSTETQWKVAYHNGIHSSNITIRKLSQLQNRMPVYQPPYGIKNFSFILHWMKSYS